MSLKNSIQCLKPNLNRSNSFFSKYILHLGDINR
ncbi:hypothetical protein FHS70_000037 [Flammeovirga yaeyamensis]|nr:hypothetical protein [Flammeovirga yaeyamensis]